MTISRPLTSSFSVSDKDHFWLVFRDYPWGLCYRLNFDPKTKKIDVKKPIAGAWHAFIDRDRCQELLSQEPNVLGVDGYLDFVDDIPGFSCTALPFAAPGGERKPGYCQSPSGFLRRSLTPSKREEKAAYKSGGTCTEFSNI